MLWQCIPGFGGGEEGGGCFVRVYVLLRFLIKGEGEKGQKSGKTLIVKEIAAKRGMRALCGKIPVALLLRWRMEREEREERERGRNASEKRGGRKNDAVVVVDGEREEREERWREKEKRICTRGGEAKNGPC